MEKKIDNQKSIKEGYYNSLKNRCFGLLNEYEKEREWESFLDSLIIEFNGIPDVDKTINYYLISHKLSSLRYLSYTYFRKTIFDIMTLLGKVEKEV